MNARRLLTSCFAFAAILCMVACTSSPPETGAECGDLLDNDGDGLVDCLDPGCTDLATPLAHALSGEVVEMSACRIEGTFRVPAGVTLRGQGRLASTLVSTGTTLVLGDGATVEHLGIENGGGHGIVAVSVASVVVRDVEVHAALGRAAIGFEDVGAVTLSEVTLTGPVTSATAAMVPSSPSETNTALRGLALLHVGAATLDRVDVVGFGQVGVLSVGSGVEWAQGSVASNLSFGLWQVGGSLLLDRVRIADTLRGSRALIPIGLLTTNDATVHTVDSVIDTTEEGWGAFHDGGAVSHERLAARGHGSGAVFAYRTTTFEIHGLTLTENSLAGVIAVEAAGLTIEDASITATHLKDQLLSDWGVVMVGDGIELIRPAPGSVLRRVTLGANERAGLLVDLGGGDTSLVTLEALDVTAVAPAHGCAVQNGTLLAGWDSGVTRRDATTDVDPSVTLEVGDLIGGTSVDPSSFDGLVHPD